MNENPEVAGMLAAGGALNDAKEGDPAPGMMGCSVQAIFSVAWNSKAGLKSAALTWV